MKNRKRQEVELRIILSSVKMGIQEVGHQSDLSGGQSSMKVGEL